MLWTTEPVVKYQRAEVTVCIDQLVISGAYTIHVCYYLSMQCVEQVKVVIYFVMEEGKPQINCMKNVAQYVAL